MINDNIVRQTARLLKQVFEFQIPTDAILSKFFRENRKLGVKDRNIIAETVYTILRNYNKLTKVVDPKNSFTLIGYACVKLLGVGRHEIRELKTINLGEIDRLPELDMSIIEFPQWVIDKLSVSIELIEIHALAHAMTLQAPLTLRINSIKVGRNEVIAKFEEQGLKAKPTKYSPYGLKLSHRTQLNRNELFLNGFVEVQDEASQLAAMLLNPKRSEMVVDFCAGSGGKSLVFGMLMHNSGRIYAFDVNERRLGNFSPRLARSGLSNIYTQVISTEHDTKVKRLNGKIDRVFIDAPCLGFGTLRRNPDLKFRQNEQSLAEINQKQLQIITAASKLLKVGGHLVYATCSIFREENQDIIAKFQENNPEFKIIPFMEVTNFPNLIVKDPNYLELNPAIHGTDGFFACILKHNQTPTLSHR